MIIKGLKKYILVIFLLFSITIPANTVSAATNADDLTAFEEIGNLIGPYKWIFTVGGIAMDSINAKKHDEMIEKYFLQVLAGIDMLNKKLGTVILNDCNIYQHSIYRNYGTFKVQLTNYLSRTNRNAFYNDLEQLYFDLPGIIISLEDKNNLLGNCSKLSQYNSFALYYLLSNLDLSIQAEYIRQTYYIAYRQDGFGGLIPLSQMNPFKLDEMDKAIIADIKSGLGNRLKEVIKHLQLLDGVDEFGGMTPFSWKKASDTRFKIVNLPQGIIGKSLKDYSFNNTDYAMVIPMFSNTILSILRIDDMKTLNKKSNYNPNWSARANCGWGYFSFDPSDGCTRMAFDNTVNIAIKNFTNSSLTSEFEFLNNATVFSYYNNRQTQLYNRHKYDRYIKLVKSELVPATKLLEQWIIEVGDTNIKIPTLTAVTEANKYVIHSLNPLYHQP